VKDPWPQVAIMGIASASNGKYKTIMHSQPLFENLGNNMTTSGPVSIFSSTINGETCKNLM
jgi:hypothetical protein